MIYLHSFLEIVPRQDRFHYSFKTFCVHFAVNCSGNLSHPHPVLFSHTLNNVLLSRYFLKKGYFLTHDSCRQGLYSYGPRTLFGYLVTSEMRCYVLSSAHTSRPPTPPNCSSVNGSRLKVDY